MLRVHRLEARSLLQMRKQKLKPQLALYKSTVPLQAAASQKIETALSVSAISSPPPPPIRPAKVPIMRKSLTDRIIMNTMSKVQNLILHETTVERESADDSRTLQSTTTTQMKISDVRAVSKLLQRELDVPAHVLRKIRETHDSHKQLDTLLSFPEYHGISLEAYLYGYLKVRYNIGDMQMINLLRHLTSKRSFENGSLIILENSNSLDLLLENCEKMLQMINQMDDAELSLDEFFMSFPNEAVLPQILKNYTNNNALSSYQSENDRLTKLLELNGMIEDQVKAIDLDNTFALEELNDFMVLSADDDVVPLALRLKLLRLRIGAINATKYGSNWKAEQIKRAIGLELQNDDFIKTPGVISRFCAMINTKDKAQVEILLAFLPKLQTTQADLKDILKLDLSKTQAESVYKQYCQMTNQNGNIQNQTFANVFVDFYVKRFPEERAYIYQLLQTHHKELSLYHLGLILCNLRRDSEKFDSLMALVEKESYPYLLGAMGSRMVSEYQDCQKKNLKTITFTEMFELVDLLKKYKVNHVSYLKHVFSEIIMDHEFIANNRDEFVDSLTRFAGKSRINLEMLSDWNGKLFEKFNDTQDVIFMNVEYYRKFLVRAMRLERSSRQDQLLKQFGVDLSMLNPSIASNFLNEIINSLNKEKGRNVITEKRVAYAMRPILESYVETCVRELRNPETAYLQCREVLNNISFAHSMDADEAGAEAEVGQLNIMMKTRPKHVLMQLITEVDPRLGSKLIYHVQDTSLIKGHLLGIINCEKLTSNQKIHRFEKILELKFHQENKMYLGDKVLIKLCELILNKLNENEMNRLTHLKKLIWVLKQCILNNVDSSFYDKWHQQLQKMKLENKGYWYGKENETFIAY